MKWKNQRQSSNVIDLRPSAGKSGRLPHVTSMPTRSSARISDSAHVNQKDKKDRLPGAGGQKK